MGGTKCLLSPTPKNMGGGHVPLSPTQTRPMTMVYQGSQQCTMSTTMYHGVPWGYHGVPQVFTGYHSVPWCTSAMVNWIPLHSTTVYHCVPWSSTVYHGVSWCTTAGAQAGGGLRGCRPPPKKKKKRERGERKRERKKKEKRGIKRERKLKQSFQEHVFMGLYCPLVTPDGPQTPDHNGVGISRLSSAPPPFAKSCLRPCTVYY